MRILIATDAWSPQVNGVVRSLQSLADYARKLGAEIEFLTPEGFPSFPLPSYASIRCGILTWRDIVRRIELAAPDALHIATEGPIGRTARRYCLAQRISFTTSDMTRFPEYISVRLPVPLSWSYAVLRRFHAAAAVTMVSTRSLLDEHANRGFAHLAMWTRGVDTDLFRPGRHGNRSAAPGFCQRRAAGCGEELGGVPGARSAWLEGRHRRWAEAAELQQRFTRPTFSGSWKEKSWLHISRQQTYSCFPAEPTHSVSSSFEALACGVPVAAYPVPGLRDVIGGNPVGVLDEDLKFACLKALTISRAACRAFALTQSWERSALQFISHSRPCLRLAAA